MLFDKLCSVNKKDDSMRNLAVMSGSGVLAHRVWLTAAYNYFQVKYFRSNNLILTNRSLTSNAVINYRLKQSSVIWTGVVRD